MSKAFTLLEILMTLGILFIVLVVSIPYSLSQLTQARVEQAARDFKSYYLLQQNNAKSGKSNSDYGIRITPTKYTLFTGNSFASGTNKEDINLNGVTINPINLTNIDIIFTKGNSKPTSSGNFTFTDGVKSIKVDINVEGVLNLINV